MRNPAGVKGPRRLRRRNGPSKVPILYTFLVKPSKGWSTEEICSHRSFGPFSNSKLMLEFARWVESERAGEGGAKIP